MPKSNTELKAIMAQFPVSSGKHHLKIENTWIPVTTTSTSATSTTSTTTSTSTTNAPKTVPMTLEKQIQEQLPELAKPKVANEQKAVNPVLLRPYNWKNDEHYMSAAIVPELAPPPPVSRAEF